MIPKRTLITCFALSGAALSMGAAELPKPDETRAYLEQWVQFRKTISEEENDWLVDKETIERSITLIRDEMEQLDREIEEFEQNATEAERRRAELTEENETYKAAARAVSEELGDLEARIKELIEYFPQPLKEKVEPLRQRIPPPAAASRFGGGARLANVVGILKQAEDFNQTITVSTSTETLPNGETARIDTVYLGLATAYFVDGQARFAGILSPAAGEWVREQDDSIAAEVKTLVDVINRATLAEFVTLPIAVK